MDFAPRLIRRRLMLHCACQPWTVITDPNRI
jgi:hypothetical protein